jgi:hypothetical protein
MEPLECGICGTGSYEEYPGVGESINCFCCDADGWGTYDNSGNYMVEWIEDDEEDK